MRTLLALPALALALALAPPAAAQDSPLVPAEVFEAFAGEISGDRSYDHLRHLTLYHSPNGASRGFQEKMQWILEQARKAGLEDVRLIRDLRYTGVAWSPVSAELWILSPERRRLTGYDDVAVAIADYSRSGTWEGELVDVGAGTREADYEGKDVKGKIVLASGSPARVMDEAVWKRGALGIVYYNTSRGTDYPDQVAWTRLNPRPPEGKQNTFAFSISYRAGLALKQRLAPRPAPGATPGSFGEGTVAGEKIVLRATVESEFHENPTNWIVEGWIRGATHRDQQIVLTAHAQEEKTSANDDNSGCANLLEIARAWTKLVREGRLARPVRDVRFWWVNEFSSQYEYFAAHPEERANLLVNINQDMVGVKQSAGSRIQHITRLPHARASYLETVIEGVAGVVMRGNSAYLAAAQAGTPQPYSRPILSLTGTRERYGAEIVPYFDNTDHHAFNDVVIGVPGVTLTNWPDPFIHSSDDDLWQMDPTQLARNAFIVAASAHYLATVAPAGVSALAAQVHATSLTRLSEAYRRANEMLLLAEPEARDAAFLDAANLIEQVVARGAAALDSLRVFAPPAAALEQIETFKAGLETGSFFLRDSLALNYSAVTGVANPPAAQPSELEQALAAKVPELAATPREILDKRSEVGRFGMHQLMAWEVWNFADGRRSARDIYRAVRAEAQLAGAWYYGEVTAQQVSDLLDAAVKAGLMRWKQ